MTKFWKWNNSADSAELTIEGTIAEESWFGDEVTPREFREELKQHANRSDLTVVINSGGGDVFAGVSIYNALRDFGGNVTVKVDGLAASIASVVAMAGDKIIMSAGSMMMIHKPWVMAMGDSDDLQKAKDILLAIEDSIIPIYEARTGLSKDEITEMLEAETWFTAEQAVEQGFADEVLEAKKKPSISDLMNSLGKNYAFSMSAAKSSMDNFLAKVSASDEPKEEDIEESTPVDEPIEEQPTDDTVVEETETSEVTEPEVEENQINSVNEEDMDSENKIDSIAVNQVKDVLVDETPVAPVAKMSANTQREMFVKQFSAFVHNDKRALTDLNKQVIAGVKDELIDDTDLTGIYQTDVIASDILKEYTNVGRVGSLVSKVNITNAEKWKQIIQAAGNGFQPVGTGEEKQEDKPSWSDLTIEPKEHALIVAWYDSMAKRTPLAVYQTVIQYIADEYAKLEDKIILSFEGVTTLGGDTFAATGLEPILRGASRIVELASYGSADIYTAFGEAYGLIDSDKPLALVCNRATWASLATAVDANDNTVFKTVGESVAIGALGTFRVVISQEVTDGSIIFGAFDDYKLVTIGGLETLFSQHATVGDINLFSSDASALRANCDIAGKPVRNTSFVVIDNTTVS